MTALAIICSYNEADIVGWTVRHLIRQGLSVQVIDCQSTDRTAWLASAAGAEVCSTQAPPVSWHSLLCQVQRLAAESEADWCMHCDADELRYSNQPGETLLEGFTRVEALCFNAVDFQTLTFHPVDDGFNGTQDPEVYFRHYSIDALNQRIGQVKAWRNVGRVDLATSGGHRVAFEGQRIYPHRFLSKHYPIRSQRHGERKVFQERQWLDREQGRRDWHVQYDGVKAGHNFLKDPATLKEWTP